MREHIIACFKCSSQVGLSMFSHRNKAGRIVGWIFSCQKCFPKVAGQKLKMVIQK